MNVAGGCGETLPPYIILPYQQKVTNSNCWLEFSNRYSTVLYFVLPTVHAQKLTISCLSMFAAVYRASSYKLVKSALGITVSPLLIFMTQPRPQVLWFLAVVVDLRSTDRTESRLEVDFAAMGMRELRLPSLRPWSCGPVDPWCC
jgi:hypothetical protein